jgi:hypothetical protein
MVVGITLEAIQQDRIVEVIVVLSIGVGHCWNKRNCWNWREGL